MCVAATEAEEVDVVLGDEGEEGGSKEHGLVIGMRKHEQDVVLLVVDPSALEDIDDYDGEEVHAKKDVFEGGVDQLRE